jgi:hypothetical protein
MAEGNANPFSPRLVAALVLGGVVAFLGFLFLTAYAPQMKVRGGNGISPMSKSAIGFYGLYRLSALTGRKADLTRNKNDWSATGFMIVTLDADTDVAKLKDLVAARRGTEDTKTLYILPKWITSPIPLNRKWVQRMATFDAQPSPEIVKVFGQIKFAEGKSVAGGRVRGVRDDEMDGVDVPMPRNPHVIVSGMQPVLVDTAGRTVLGRTDFDNGSADYILADPDLLSNMALKTPEGARNALAIVDALRANSDDSVGFDMVLNGVDNRNLLQLMFEPPFLALTLAVLAAALLVGIHAFGRFGPAVPEPRAIPFGKRALADNAAILLARAGAVRRLGDRYVAMVRDGAASALGASAMAPDALEAWLAKLPGISGTDFGKLAAAARGAKDSEGMRAAAQALHHWKEEVTRDRR